MIFGMYGVNPWMKHDWEENDIEHEEYAVLSLLLSLYDLLQPTREWKKR